MQLKNTTPAKHHHQFTLDAEVTRQLEKTLFPARVVRMWPGGPLRRISPVKSTTTPMQSTSDVFVGAYVCTKCHKPVDGVYGREWRCGACRKLKVASRGMAF